MNVGALGGRSLRALQNFSKQADGMQTFSTRALQHFLNDVKWAEKYFSKL